VSIRFDTFQGAAATGATELSALDFEPATARVLRRQAKPSELGSM